MSSPRRSINPNAGHPAAAVERFVNVLSLQTLLLAGGEREVIEIAPALTSDPFIGLIAKAVLFAAYHDLHQPERAAPYRAAAQIWLKTLGPGLWRDKLATALQTIQPAAE